jgi:hypothetical protein
MRLWLVSAIIGVSLAAGGLTEIILFRAFRPPDTQVALVGATWVVLPYLAAIGFAVGFRRPVTALVAILVILLVTAPVALFLLSTAAEGMVAARQQAATAVLPGESPDHGPGGMRKAGADLGVALAGVFDVVVTGVVPPVQLLIVGTTAILGYVVSYRAEARRQWEIEHTDTREPGS